MEEGVGFATSDMVLPIKTGASASLLPEGEDRSDSSANVQGLPSSDLCFLSLASPGASKFVDV